MPPEPRSYVYFNLHYFYLLEMKLYSQQHIRLWISYRYYFKGINAEIELLQRDVLLTFVYIYHFRVVMSCSRSTTITKVSLLVDMETVLPLRHSQDLAFHQHRMVFCLRKRHGSFYSITR
jgi:hypothetical protein